MKQLIGQQIGPYQIEALLGEGGMGLVFRAHDLKNDRLVALKIMLGNLVNKPQFRSRFLHEAEAIAHFNSPAIVKIFDTGVHEESPYIVMEHIEGGSLINYLRQLDYSGTRPTIELITTLAAQIAEGLSYAHQRGLIHRDIKPGNILLKMREGVYQPRQAVITDFGLAVQFKEGDQMDTAPFMGSLAYMSPEQCENKPLDGRSDIYALGILLYQLTTGKLPFQINAPADIVKHLEETPLPPGLINPDLPEILETITLKAMEKKPADRYQSAAEMAHALRQALTNPALQTAVLAADSQNAVTQWLDNKWVAAVDVEDRVDIHQTWTSLGQNRLFIVHQYEESRIVGLDKDEIIIGRDASCDVVLAEQSVSSKHLRLTRTPHGWQVSDLGSTNHTFLGEKLLEYEQAYDWPSSEVCRLGPYFLRWQPFDAQQRPMHQAAPLLAGAALLDAAVQPEAAVAVPPTAAEPVYSDGEILGIALNPPTMELEPNGQNLLEISITNRDVTVKEISLRLEVDGLPPAWVSLTDYQMKLLPDESKSTTALVDLSQAPDILADAHLLRLIATTDKGEVETNQARIVVKKQEEFALDLHPSKLQEKITCRLTISDRSNFQNQYTIMGIDDSDALVFEFEEPQNAVLVNFEEQQQEIKVAPRHEAWVGFRIRPRKRPLFGANETYPFKIRVRTPDTDWQSLSGDVEIAPRITRRLLLFLLLIFLLIGGAGYLAFYQYQTAQAERYAELQGQLNEAEQRAQAAREQLDSIETQIEEARAAGASDEELAALEAARDAVAAELEAASADAAALGNEVEIDPTAAAEATATAAAATAEAAAAATADAAAIIAAYTPTPVPNNPPTGIAFSASSITENSAIGSVVGEFSAIDADAAAAGGNGVSSNQPSANQRTRLSRLAQQSDAFTFSLVSGSGSTHNDYFTIKGNQLVTVMDINYEETPTLTFRVEVEDAAGDTFAQSFTLVVTDVDDMPTLSITNMTVSEAAGTAELTVSVSGDNFDTATVAYATENGTAVAGEDYTATSGDLTWDKGNTDNQVIKIPLIDNELDQPDRTFVVTLSNAENATISSGSATITLTDDDNAPTLSVADLTVSEAVTGGKATITVQMTGASSQEVSVDYTTAPGTATAGTGGDYITTNGTLTWAAETTGAKTFAVTINADDIDEPNETFTIILSGVENATLSDGEATITIADDNDAPRITIGDVTVSEGGGQVTVPVTMTGRSSEEAWVDYSTSNGNGSSAATADLPDPDFNPTIGRLTWAAGTEGKQEIIVQINDDDIDEASPEFFVISLFDNAPSIVLQDPAGTIYITDNDDEPVLSLGSVTPSPVPEDAGTAQVPVTIVGRSSREVTAYYRTQNGTAVAGEDYTAVVNSTLTWSPLDTTAKTIRLTILDDELYEDTNETFTVSLTSADNGEVSSSSSVATITIENDDPLPVISASISSGDVDEDSGEMTIEVSLDRASTQPITVNYTTIADSAGAHPALVGTDFVSKTGALSWSARNNTPKIITINIVDDNIYEADETFLFRLHTPTNATFADSSTAPADTVVEILDNEPTPIIAVVNADPVTVTESISATQLAVALNRPTSIPITVAWFTQANSAQPGRDYIYGSGTLTWNSSTVLTQTIPLIILEDEVDELTENFTVVLQNATVGVLEASSASTTIAITDNDDPPVLSISSLAVPEGNNSDNPALAVPVTMLRSSYVTVTVAYSITGGTAVSGTDFIDNGSGLLTWPPETSGDQTIPLQILSDHLDEGSGETITLLIQNVSPAGAASIGVASATATISDDDDPPIIDIRSVTASEAAGTAVITATMSGVSANNISVSYATADNSATAGLDYTSAAGSLTWPAGTEGGQSFTVTLLDDALDEPTETVDITLFNISGGAASFNNNTASLILTDDDETPVITANQVRSVAEGSAAGNIGSPLAATDGDGDTVQDWTLVSITPSSPAPYFSVDASSGQISLTSVGAAALDYETQTVYTLTLTVSDGANTSAPETVTLSVQDIDDEAPQVTANTGLIVNEGGSFTLTISQLNATDPDSNNNSLLFTITSGPTNGYLDNGVITGTAGITFTRQMLTANAVSYSHDGSNTLTDSFNFTVSDPANNAAASETFNITITPLNDLPVLSLDANNSSGVGSGGYAATFTEDGGAVAIVDSDLSLTDADSANMNSATVTIANIQDGAAEVLNATVGATGITAVYANGELQLTGPSSTANFQQVLRTVTYNNSSQAPTTTTRTIEFVVTDDGSPNASSASVSSAVTIIAVNDAPILDNTSDLTLTSIISNTTNPTGNTVASILSSAGTTPITDPDAGALIGIAVIDDCVEASCSGTWQYFLSGGVIWNDFPSNVAANRAVLLGLNDRLRFVPNTNFTGSHSIQFRAWDRTSGSSGNTNVDTTSNGGATAFSTATETAVITVTLN